MKKLSYSFIIPVYNRPDEIAELLASFTQLEGDFSYEIVIVEDGSTISSDNVVEGFSEQLNIAYFSKQNTGPGDSRNYGMAKARGNYFIILDSDVLLPNSYLVNVDRFLNSRFFHCFGGPDSVHQSFTNVQKAINFAMTSFLTTGGIRGGGEILEDFQPRSFNMGLSKDAFLQSNGFGTIHPGEDPDLALRLQKLGYSTTLIKDAKVYHKRRLSWKKFYQQVQKFGLARPILNRWHPKSKSIVFWLPTLFSVALLVSIALTVFHIFLPIYFFVIYFFVIIVFSSVVNKSIVVGLLSFFAVCIQFFGYGSGFLVSSLKLMFIKKSPQELFPKLFFKS